MPSDSWREEMVGSCQNSRLASRFNVTRQVLPSAPCAVTVTLGDVELKGSHASLAREKTGYRLVVKGDGVLFDDFAVFPDDERGVGGLGDAARGFGSTAVGAGVLQTKSSAGNPVLDHILHRLSEPINLVQRSVDIRRNPEPRTVRMPDANNEDPMLVPQVAYQLTRLVPFETHVRDCTTH